MIQSVNFGESPKKQFTFKVPGSEKVISLANSGQFINNLVIENNFSQQNQTFILIPSDEFYYIKCKSNGLYLTVQNLMDGCRIYCSVRTGQPNQKFRLEENKAGSQQYIIYTFCGKVLDADNGKKSKGNISVIQNQYNGKSTQIWHIKEQTQFCPE